MDLYKNGKVVSIGKTYIIFESNNSGSIIYCANPKEFVKGNNIKLYIYNHKTDYKETIYGFKTFEDRIFFENLISVSGVGPRTAMNIMKDGSQKAINIIANGDIESLGNYPSMGKASASKVVFDLQDKYKDYKEKKKGKYISHDIKDSLKILGFSQNQIKYALDKVKPDNSLEAMVESAIRVISSAKFT